MKILNWNTCSFSTKQDKVIQKALEYGADILTLQEVKPENLEILKKLEEYHISYTEDSSSEKGGCFLVILSKKEVVSEGTYDYHDGDFSSFAMRVFNMKSKVVEDHKALYIDIVVDGKEVRIFNIHISWPVSPSIRVEQFSNFMKFVDKDARNIICGDLNVFGHLTYYNYLVALPFGYKKEDLHFDEREWFDEQFASLKLKNPFEGTVSWPKIPFKAQLDHILVPEDMKVISKNHGEKTYGSDHIPYLLEVEL